MEIVKGRCLKCTGIMSNVPIDERTVLVKEVENRRAFIYDNIVNNKNNLGNCELCGEPLTITFD